MASQKASGRRPPAPKSTLPDRAISGSLPRLANRHRPRAPSLLLDHHIRPREWTFLIRGVIMSRLVAIALCGLFAVGCGLGRMDMKANGPISVATVPPIHQSINAANADDGRGLMASK